MAEVTARVCLECGADISASHPYTKRCSKECKKQGAIVRSQAWREANRERHRAYTRSWTAANPERKRESDRSYREENRDRLIEYQRKLYADNREERRAKSKTWRKENKKRVNFERRARRAANPEKFRTQQRVWAENNRDRLRALARQWQKANPAKVNERNRGRYARKRGLLGTVTKGITEVLIQNQGYRCSAPGCRKRIGKKAKRDYHLDHIIAIAAGGLHDDANLQVLCVKCNLQKGAKNPLIFARERGMLL